jgi:hypothetical protein
MKFGEVLWTKGHRGAVHLTSSHIQRIQKLHEKTLLSYCYVCFLNYFPLSCVRGLAGTAAGEEVEIWLQNVQGIKGFEMLEPARLIQTPEGPSIDERLQGEKLGRGWRRAN